MKPENRTDERDAVRSDPVRLRLKHLLRRNDLTLAAASAGHRPQQDLPSTVRRARRARGPRLSRRRDFGCAARVRPRRVAARDRAETQAREARAAKNTGRASRRARGRHPRNSRGRRRRSGDPRRRVRHRDGALALAREHDPPRGRRRAREPAHHQGAGRLHGAGKCGTATASWSTSHAGRPPPARRSCSGTATGSWSKRVEAVHRDEGLADGDEPPRLRLISANPDYAPYTCLAQDVHVLGRVLWAVRRV